MRKEDFFEVLGELDDDIVKGAQTTMKKKMNRKVWGAMAACLAIAIMAGAVFSPIIRTEPGRHENKVADLEAETRDITIYYVSEGDIIEHRSVELQGTPKDIFDEWAVLNNISGVTFVSCVYDDGGSEKQQGNVTEYTIGNYYTLDLTVSTEFSSYARGEQGDLLIQSLRQTFCDYVSINDFNLIIAN